MQSRRMVSSPDCSQVPRTGGKRVRRYLVQGGSATRGFDLIFKKDFGELSCENYKSPDGGNLERIPGKRGHKKALT